MNKNFKTCTKLIIIRYLKAKANGFHAFTRNTLLMHDDIVKIEVQLERVSNELPFFGETWFPSVNEGQWKYI
jgi:hypothetical protein